MPQLESIYTHTSKVSTEISLIDKIDLPLWKTFSEKVEREDFYLFVQPRYQLLVSILSNGKKYKENYTFNNQEMTNLYHLLKCFQVLMISYSCFHFIGEEKRFNDFVTKKFILGLLLSSFELITKPKNLYITLIFNRNLMRKVINFRLTSRIDTNFVLPIVDNILLFIETLLYKLVEFKRLNNNFLKEKNGTHFKIQAQRKTIMPKTFTKELDKLIKPSKIHIQIVKMFIYSHMKLLKGLKWEEISKLIENDSLFKTKLHKRRQYILSNLLLFQDLDLLSYFRLIDSKGCF